MIACNEDQTTESRIAKTTELRDKILTLKDRVNQSDKRIIVFRKLDAQLTALEESQNESTHSFDSDFIRAEFQDYLQSIPPPMPLSSQCSILHDVNILLRTLQSNEDIVEEATGASVRTRIDRCPFLNATLEVPNFSRCCPHRYYAKGLLNAFNQSHQPRVRDWKDIPDIPRDIEIPCPVAGCSVLLAGNGMQRDFIGLPTKYTFPESSPLDVVYSQPYTSPAGNSDE